MYFNGVSGMVAIDEYRIFTCGWCSATYTAKELALNKNICKVCSKKSKKGFVFDPNWVANQIVSFLMQKYNIITIKDTKEMLIYNKETGIYEEGEFIINQEISNFEDVVKNSIPKEIIYKIQCKTYIERKQLNPKNILITNNVVIIFNEKGYVIDDFNPKFYCNHKIPVYYDPTKECKEINKFVANIVQPEYNNLVYEMIAYTIYPDYPISAFFILNGTGRNGKTKLINLIQAFLGEGNICNVPLQKLVTNSFQLAELYGKKANLFADLPNKPLDESGILKCLTGGDTITVEKKHKNPFTFKNVAKIIYSANDIPEVRDNTEAFYYRLELIFFPYVFDVRKRDHPNFKEPDNSIEDKIITQDELSGLLNVCLEKLSPLLIRRCFDSPLNIEEKKRLFDKQSNPIKAFFDECLIAHGSCYITKSTLYAKYCEWCNDFGAIKSDYDVFFKRLKQATTIVYEEGKENIDENRVAVLRGLCFNPNYFYYKVKTPEKKAKGKELIENCHREFGKDTFNQNNFWDNLAMYNEIEGEDNE